MHVRTLGSPATGPVVTASWQYSVQPIFFPTWMLWGNSSGCSGAGRQPRKSLSAAATVGRAVVKTALLCPGSSGPVLVDVGVLSSSRQPMLPARTSAPRTSAALTYCSLRNQRAGLAPRAAGLAPGAAGLAPGAAGFAAAPGGPMLRTKLMTSQTFFSVSVP